MPNSHLRKVVEGEKGEQENRSPDEGAGGKFVTNGKLVGNWWETSQPTALKSGLGNLTSEKQATVAHLKLTAKQTISKTLKKGGKLWALKHKLINTN